MKVKLSMGGHCNQSAGMYKVSWIKQLRTECGTFTDVSGSCCYLSLKDAKDVADIIQTLYENSDRNQTEFVINLDDYRSYLVDIFDLILERAKNSSLVSLYTEDAKEPSVKESLKKVLGQLVESEDYNNVLKIIDILKTLR